MLAPGAAKAAPRTLSGRGALLRSAGIRFAIIYAVVFGVTALMLAMVLWCSTLTVLQDQVRYAIRNDTLALLDHYQVGGVPSLEAAIAERLEGPTNPDGIYLLVTAGKQRLAGNLEGWPTGLDLPEVWYKLSVQHGDVKSVALLRMQPLPNGLKLLVGRDISARLQLRNVLRFGLVGALVMTLILGFVGAALVRSLFRRAIREISITTNAIARGDITRRVPLNGYGDEFDELASGINEMLDRIARLMDGVKQVSNSIAHDLRTPVARARARLEDSALHATSRPDMEAAVERAIQDLDDIAAVFQALLRITEIEVGAQRRAFATFDLSTTILDIDELYSVVAEEKDITLRTIVSPLLLVFGDRELLQQAVVNLLDNALKFSPPGTQVTVEAQHVGEAVQIVVADQGPGIKKADRDRATERFFRAESARHTAGSGLGLALVAAVVQLHNGKLSLEDNNPGLRAQIFLPCERSSK